MLVTYIQGRRQRAIALARWVERRDIIRAMRFRSTPRQVNNDPSVWLHGTQCPWHCVCNGTHLHHGFCPRCEWTRVYDFSGDRVEW